MFNRKEERLHRGGTGQEENHRKRVGDAGVGGSQGGGEQ